MRLSINSGTVHKIVMKLGDNETVISKFILFQLLYNDQIMLTINIYGNAETKVFDIAMYAFSTHAKSLFQYDKATYKHQNLVCIKHICEYQRVTRTM